MSTEASKLTTKTTKPELRVLNVVISVPEARGGAIRAGLLLGDYLSEYIDVDSVKMVGDHDGDLHEELNLNHGFSPIPSHTLVRDLGSRVLNSSNNYSNTVITTNLTPPRDLQEYDLVHLHNAVPLWSFLAAALQCMRAGVPYTITTHGISKIPELPENLGLSSVQKKLFRHLFLRPYMYVLENASHLFALSKGDKDRLLHLFPTQSVSVVPNGVRQNPPEKNTTKLVEAELGIPKSTNIILFVGKIMESKGVEELLTAYENTSMDGTLIVVGPPENQEYVDRMNSFDSSQLQYLGYTRQDLLDALYQRADVFVFPTRSDVFPLVTLEAMAAETPVISTTVGGIPEQITEKTGFLVPPRDPEAVSEKIELLLENETKRQMMGKEALKRVNNKFSWDNVAKQTALAYEDIIERNTHNI